MSSFQNVRAGAAYAVETSHARMLAAGSVLAHWLEAVNASPGETSDVEALASLVSILQQFSIAVEDYRRAQAVTAALARVDGEGAPLVATVVG